MGNEFKIQKKFNWNILHELIKKVQESISLPLKIKLSNDNLKDKLLLGYKYAGDTETIVDNTSVTILTGLSIRFGEGVNLVSINMLQLESLGATDYGYGQWSSIWLVNNINLTTVNLPKLKYVSNPIIITLPILESLNLDSLKIAGQTISIKDCPLLTSLDLSQLEYVGGNLEIDNTAVTDLNVSKLSHAYNLQITNNPLLTSVDLSGLKDSVQNAFWITNNSALTNIILPEDGVGLIDAPYIFTTNALSQECVDNILSGLRNYAENNDVLNKTLNLHGGTNASPSDGVLNPNYDYLVNTKGWTVTIN